MVKEGSVILQWESDTRAKDTRAKDTRAKDSRAEFPTGWTLGRKQIILIT